MKPWTERVVEDATGCLVWTGYLDSCGYPRWTTARRFAGTSLAHRVVYMLEVGPIPEGFQIDHLCRNRGCVNPAHLEAVTISENQRRSLSFAGVNARKTHCVHGHEYTPENTVIKSDGYRSCRTCGRQRSESRRLSPPLPPSPRSVP